MPQYKNPATGSVVDVGVGQAPQGYVLVGSEPSQTNVGDRFINPEQLNQFGGFVRDQLTPLGATEADINNILTNELTIKQGQDIFKRTDAPSIEALRARFAPTQGTVDINMSDTANISSLDGTATTESDLSKLMEENNKLRQQYLDLITPTEEERTVQKQLDALISNAQAGIDLTGEQVIPLEFVTGQQQAIENRFLRQAGVLERQLERLQSARGSEKEGLLAIMGFNSDDITRIEDRLKDAKAEKDKLEDNQRTLLDNIINSVTSSGKTFDQLTPDTQAQITKLASQFNLPMDVVRNQISAAKTAYDLEIQAAQADIARTRQLSGGGISNTKRTPSQGFFNIDIEDDFREDAVAIAQQIQNGEIDNDTGYNTLRALYSGSDVTDEAIRTTLNRALGIVPAGSEDVPGLTSNQINPNEFTPATGGKDLLVLDSSGNVVGTTNIPVQSDTDFVKELLELDKKQETPEEKVTGMINETGKNQGSLLQSIINLWK